MKTMSFLMIFTLVLTACTAGGEKARLLPNEGATTAELLGYTNRGHHSLYHDPSITQGIALLPNYQGRSHHTHTHLRELQRDFQQVPNPQILAYVYPHLNQGELPIPGYFTVFNLYDATHYALSAEGEHVIDY